MLSYEEKQLILKKYNNNEYLNSNIELLKCVKFLILNDWHEDFENELFSYHKKNSISIDIHENEIVLIDDTGDFKHLKLSYYALIGVLIELRQISFNYVSVRI